MSSSAVYPNGILPWTDRVNFSTIQAADVDQLGDDLVAVETTLGTNPQNEPSPVAGTGPAEYPTVGDRISSVQSGQHLPVAQLTSPAMLVSNGQSAANSYGVWNAYAASYDPYQCFNGYDITVPVTGWWRVTAGQFWNWWATGYNAMSLWIASIQQDIDIWHWDFVGNSSTGFWQGMTGSIVSPPVGTPPAIPVHRPGATRVSYEGQIQAGSRIRVLSENGTSDAQHPASGLVLSASLLRTI